MYRIIIEVWATVASGAMNFKNYKKWLNVIESELKSTRARCSVAAVLTPVLNIAQKVTSTRWAFKIKSKGRLMARLVALGQKHGIEYGVTFVYRFDLLVTAVAKRVVIQDVQPVLLSWFLDRK